MPGRTKNTAKAGRFAGLALFGFGGCLGCRANYRFGSSGLGVRTRIQQRQCHCKHVFNALGIVDGHAFGQLRRQVFLHVLAVVGGQDDGCHSSPARGQELLLDAAHRQDVSTERDFACHGC